MSPFYVLYGEECRNPTSVATPNSEIEGLNQMIKEIHSILEYAKQCMQDAQEISKFYADQRRSVQEFEVGQKLFLKVMPKRFGVRLWRSRKLCGLLQILKRVGRVAYVLDLLTNWKFYNVFYVSLLIRYVSDPNHVLPYLLQVSLRGRCWLNLKNFVG